MRFEEGFFGIYPIIPFKSILNNKLSKHNPDNKRVKRYSRSIFHAKLKPVPEKANC
jgi:hypothetical protein